MRHLRQCCRYLLLLCVLTCVAVPAARAEPERSIPAFVGLSRAEVGTWFDQLGWKAEWRSAGPAPGPQQQGRVASQAPAAGVAASASGVQVILWVYEGEAAAAAASLGAVAAAPRAADCSRWSGSVADPASGACRCATGLWWKLDGAGCATREEAAAQFCSGEWAGSRPTWSTSGDFHCDCSADLFWDAEAQACGAPHPDAGADCNERWPGTRPVFSPGATAYQCVCPGGSRWEESQHRCQISVDAGGLGMMVPAAPAAQVPIQPATPSQQAPSADTYGDGGAQPDGAAPVDDSGCESLLAEIRGRAAAGQTSQAEGLALRAATRGCNPGAISAAVRGEAGSPAAPVPAPSAPAPRQQPAMHY